MALGDPLPQPPHAHSCLLQMGTKPGTANRAIAMESEGEAVLGEGEVGVGACAEAGH